MTTGIDPDWLWGLTLFAVFAFLAVLPTMIGLLRGADDIMLIVLINVLCCLTVLFWPLALITAIKWPRKYPKPRRAPRVHPRRWQEPYV